MIGVYHWIPKLEVGLLVEQDLTEAFAAILTNLEVNLVIALVTLLLNIGASLIITRTISKPLIDLATTAN